MDRHPVVPGLLTTMRGTMEPLMEARLLLDLANKVETKVETKEALSEFMALDLHTTKAKVPQSLRTRDHLSLTIEDHLLPRQTHMMKNLLEEQSKPLDGSFCQMELTSEFTTLPIQLETREAALPHSFLALMEEAVDLPEMRSTLAASLETGKTKGLMILAG